MKGLAKFLCASMVVSSMVSMPVLAAKDDFVIQDEGIVSEDFVEEDDFEEAGFEEDVIEETEAFVDESVMASESEMLLEDETESEASELFEADNVYGNTAKGFVFRLYKNVLNRTPAASEVDYWANQLTSGKKNGAEVAEGFIHSTELKNRKLSDTAYVEMMYQTFLNRRSDASGRNYWLNLMNKGMSRDYVFKGFVNSTEFQKICGQYGIKSGTVALTEARDQNEGVTMFIARCYDKFLGRKGEPDGLNYWCQRLLSGKDTGKDAAKGFVLSNEFLSKGMSDEAFIRTLYRGIFDREADAGGMAYWQERLSMGMSREEVFYGFADSNEFRNLVGGFGLKNNWSTTSVSSIYSYDNFQILLPASWEGKYVVKYENYGYPEIVFYEKTNYEYYLANKDRTGLMYPVKRGVLFGIEWRTKYVKPSSITGCQKYLGSCNGKYYYATRSTDVAYNNNLMNNYIPLGNQVNSVIDSFRIK